MRAPPLGLYVHLPWCIRKCPYCDFNSHALRGELPEAAYVEAVLADLDAEPAAAGARPLESVFFGGGTPSLFSARALGALLEGIARRFTLAAGCEVTLEANPGAADHARFAGYRAAGVNRLSIGVQSFDDAMLGALGRVHDGATARAALRAARAAGFARLNADLMCTLPGQTPRGARSDVAEALALGATHVSSYELTIEPNTWFHHHRPAGIPDEDTAEGIAGEVAECLAAAGFERYEVSAWAPPGEEARHNLNYWRYGDYLGVGAGAHGKLTDAAADEVIRSVREPHPRRYVEATRAGTAVAGRRAVDAAERAFEFMLNALRLPAGFPAALFEERTGLALRDIEGALAQAEARGLLAVHAAQVVPSDLGMRFHNDLVRLFLPEETPRATNP